MNYRRQATHFSTENSINKPAVSNGRLLIATVFHLTDSFSLPPLASPLDFRSSVSTKCGCASWIMELLWLLCKLSSTRFSNYHTVFMTRYSLKQSRTTPSTLSVFIFYFNERKVWLVIRFKIMTSCTWAFLPRIIVFIK